MANERMLLCKRLVNKKQSESTLVGYNFFQSIGIALGLDDTNVVGCSSGRLILLLANSNKLLLRLLDSPDNTATLLYLPFLENNDNG